MSRVENTCITGSPEIWRTCLHPLVHLFANSEYIIDMGTNIGTFVLTFDKSKFDKFVCERVNKLNFDLVNSYECLKILDVSPTLNMSDDKRIWIKTTIDSVNYKLVPDALSGNGLEYSQLSDSIIQYKFRFKIYLDQ